MDDVFTSDDDVYVLVFRILVVADFDDSFYYDVTTVLVKHEVGRINVDHIVPYYFKIDNFVEVMDLYD